MNLTEMIGAIRIEVQNTEADTDAVTRAVGKTVSLMSRLLPKRSIVEAKIEGDVTGETLVIASSTGTLAVHPVKVGSVSMSGSKVEGTHFSVNHLTGVVTEIGSGLTDGSYTVSYSRDPRVFDIAEEISDCIKIERVEYPAGEEPPVNPTFENIGNFLFFKGRDFQLSEDNYLRAIYLSAWTPPSDEDGDYPSHLDDAVIIGSAGQYLIFMAEDYVQEAHTALATLTAPTVYTVVKPTIGAFPNAPTAPTLSTLTPPDSYTISKPGSPSLPGLPTAPAPPGISLGAAEGAMGAVANAIDAAIAYLTSGVTYINSSTRGNNVAANYGSYGGVAMEGAGHRASEAVARIRQVEAEIGYYASQVTAFGSEVNAYANNINGLIGKYREDINNEVAGINNVNVNVQKYLAEIQEDQNLVAKYREEVNQYVAQTNALVNKFRSEIDNEVIGINNFASQVTRYQAQIQEQEMKSRNLLDIAGRYLASGQSKINEFLMMLGIKMEFPTTKLTSEGGA